MRRARIRVASALAVAVAVATTASAAHGDVFGVTDAQAPAPRTDEDLVVTNANGLAGSLPAGVNTDASEFHPSVSADGTRLVFESDPAPNTRRIVVVDLTTGQSADLLNGFEAASIKPTTPSITPDGKAVLIGTGSGTGPLLIDVANFPSGPYPRTDVGATSNTLGP